MWPIHDRPGPLSLDVNSGQIQQLTGGLWRREGGLRLGHTPNLPVIGFNGVGGGRLAANRDDPANIGRIVEESRQVIPVLLPRLHRNGIVGAPCFG